MSWYRVRLILFDISTLTVNGECISVTVGLDWVWIQYGLHLYIDDKQKRGNDRITSSFIMIQNNSEPDVKVVRA